MESSLFVRMVERAAHQFTLTISGIRMRRASIEHAERMAAALCAAGIVVETGFDAGYTPLLRATVAVEDLPAFASKAAVAVERQVVRANPTTADDGYLIMPAASDDCMPVTRIEVEPF